MPRRSKGPRLYLRNGRAERGQGQVWVIRDGSTEVSTGCGPERLSGPDGAEQALADYIAAKWKPPAAVQRSGDPAGVLVSEVLAFYGQSRAPDLSDAASNAGWIKALLGFDGWTSLADVKMSTCKAYVAWRQTHLWKQAKTAERYVTDQGARRELEVLSAAIGHWAKEHALSPRPIVTLPAKAEGSKDALTRSQAAALLWAAMGWRKGEDGAWSRLGPSAVSNRRHLRRLVLIGLYSGTRPGVLPNILWERSPVQAHVDLDDGAIYRKGAAEREHRTKRRPMVRLCPRLLAHMRRWRRLDLEAGVECNTVLHHGGEPLAGRVRTGFEGIVRDAGLPAQITPHWMRHTCATWLMEGDAPIWDAAAYLGMTPSVLEKHYGSHRPDHQSRARKALR